MLTQTILNVWRADVIRNEKAKLRKQKSRKKVVEVDGMNKKLIANVEGKDKNEKEFLKSKKEEGKLCFFAVYLCYIGIHSSF